MIMAAPGSRSDGLRMSEFPVAMAIGRDQRGIIAGKLNLVAIFQFDQYAFLFSFREALIVKKESDGEKWTYGQIAAPTPRGTRRV